MPPVFDALLQAFDTFHKTLDGATVPAPDGGRKVLGIPHAIALSEATDALYRAAADASFAMNAAHAVPLASMPESITLLGSDSPDGPWTEVPAEALSLSMMPIGGGAADARLVAALDSALKIAGFPLERFNAAQSQRPGAFHHRWQTGDTLTAEQLDTLKASAGIFRLLCGKPARASRRV